MVLDVVNLPMERPAMADLGRQKLFHPPDAAMVLQPIPDCVEAGTVLEREERLLEEVGLGVA